MNTKNEAYRIERDSMGEIGVAADKLWGADRDKMKSNLYNSSMLVTALSQKIGYESTAKAARLTHTEGLSLKEARLRLSILSEEEYEKFVRPEDMV